MENEDTITDESDLIRAAIAGHSGAVEAALGREDVNLSDSDGWTALHIAARNGNNDICRLLLSRPTIDVNVKNKWKSTPLMIAAGSGNLDVVELLLRHPRTQVDLQAEYYGRTALIEADKTGRNSALVEAIKNGHAHVATYLLRSGLVDFSDRDLRLQALICCGSRGGDLMQAELNAAMKTFFRQMERIAS